MMIGNQTTILKEHLLDVKQDFENGVRFEPLNSNTYQTDDVQHS